MLEAKRLSILIGPKNRGQASKILPLAQNKAQRRVPTPAQLHEKIRYWQDDLDICFGPLSAIVQPRTTSVVVRGLDAQITPQAQARVGYLLEDVLTYQNQIIVETHSIYLLQQIQILVASGRLSREEVGIYYCGVDGTKELEMLENGQFKAGVPEGYFNVAFDLSMRLGALAHKKTTQ